MTTLELLPSMIGQSVSHYRVTEQLGAGGMGEVYRARDERLGREVALKVLPKAFVTDLDRKARFEREAQVLASLNHPNIGGIYGLEECDGVYYLVLELVPGKTLAELLRPGALDPKEALRICRQIAEALESAHERGIIHRDLKPANVKVTPEGKAKVLDFGLAKAFGSDTAGVDLSQSPTASVGGTGKGIILGTAAYMSPEQARGKPLDRRTDIWSFGCVLYEALTGRQAFPGETVSDTIARILEHEPDWQALPATTPPGIRVLLRRCLRKDLGQRLHDIADVRIEIEEALSSPQAETARAVWPRVQRWPLAAFALACALLGALGAWLAICGLGISPRRPSALAQVIRLTHDPGLSEWPTWSPDGTLLAFASNRSGNFEIYVRRVEGGQEVNITQDAGDDLQPAFSPDGKRVAFVSTRTSQTPTVKIGATFGFEFRTFGGDIWVAPALGGQARRLAQDANFPAWHTEGQRIAYVSGPEDHRSIVEVSADGGTPKTLLSSESSSWEIVRLQYTPNGKWITFDTVNPEKVMLMPATGGTPRELMNGLSHVWDSSGKTLYYLTRDPLGGTRLQSVAIDSGTGSLRGKSHTVGLMTGILRDLAISRDGLRFAASELEGSLNLTRLRLGPDGAAPAGPEEQLSSGQVIDRYPSFSPDGRRVAFASDRLGREEIWVLELENRRLERLQLPGEDLGVNLPFWTLDGQRLTVTRFYPDGKRSLWLVAVDGSQAEELRPPAQGLQGEPISPDGRKVLFSAKAGDFLQLFTLDLASRDVQQLTSSRGDKYSAGWSPDGRWISFTSNVSGFVQVWRIPASGGDEERLTSGKDRIRHAFYSPDGRWLYLQPNHHNIYRIPASGGTLQKVTSFPESGLFIEEPALSPDGRYLVYCRSNGGSSLWVLTTEKAP